MTTVISERVVFSGEAAGANVRGSVLEARFQTGALAFDHYVPRVRVQALCNNTLFDVGCGLAKAAWKFTATVDSPGTAGWPFTLSLSALDRETGADPTMGLDYFAGGWLEIGQDRVPIRASTVPVGGSLVLTLGRDPEPFPAGGEPVALFPGCDGRRETCADKFGNYVNFLGHPFIPTANPSLVKLSSSVNGGKK